MPPCLCTTFTPPSPRGSPGTSFRPPRSPGPGLARDPPALTYPDRCTHRLRQNPGGLSRRHRRTGARRPQPTLARRDTGVVRLAAQGLVQRHPKKSRSAAGGHSRRIADAATTRRGHPRHGAHRRHPARRARAHAPPAAAYFGDHTGIAVHPAQFRFGPAPIANRAQCHRR